MSAVSVYYAVRELLRDPSGDINMNDADALRTSAKYGHTEHVRELLHRGAKVDAGENEALVEASRWGHIEIVQLLLEHGADPHSQNRMALGNAVLYRHTSIACLLIPRCRGHVDLAQADTGFKCTTARVPYPKILPCVAAYNNDTHILHALLDNGVSHKYIRDALRMAIDKKHEDATRVLTNHMLQTTVQTDNVEQLLQCVTQDNIDMWRASGVVSPTRTPMVNEALQRAAIEKTHDQLYVTKDDVDMLLHALESWRTPILEEALQRAIEKRRDAMHLVTDHLRATGQTNATENPQPPSKPRQNKKDKDTLGCICS